MTSGLSLALWAVVVMLSLNVLMVALTLLTKALRSLRQRGTKARIRRLESALDESLATGEVHPGLRRLGDRDMDLLALLMVEYLSLLRGAERERLVRLAREAGLVRRYFASLGARYRWRKARAAENLGYFGGPEAVGPLAQTLSHPNETVRAVAARALARIGTPEAAEALAGTLSDTSELTRLRMAENLERIGPLAVGPLVEVLEGDDPRARVFAARILGNLRAAEAGASLREAMLGGETTDVRAQAALAVGKIGNPEDVQTLREAAGDEDWPVRAQAANALGMIGELAAIPTLQSLATDTEWWVRLNASRALANMGPSGERALAEILEGEDRFARDRVAATLEERGIVRRVVEELGLPGERGKGARAMIRAMVRAGAVRYLERLAKTLPDEGARKILVQTMAEARER